MCEMRTFPQMVECHFKVHFWDLYSTSQVQQFEDTRSNLTRENTVSPVLGALCRSAVHINV